jgi:ATP-dependent Clp protease protease subunit
MIHNAWTYAMGNADELRKQADDLEKITSASIAAYMTHANISKNKLKELMDAETWLTPKEAKRMGFASQIAEDEEADKPSQSAKKRAFELFLQSFMSKGVEDGEDVPEQLDDESIEDEEENGENGNSEPESAPDANEDENPEDEPEQDESAEEQEPNPNEAAQQWSGFFNAIFRV